MPPTVCPICYWNFIIPGDFLFHFEIPPRHLLSFGRLLSQSVSTSILIYGLTGDVVASLIIIVIIATPMISSNTNMFVSQLGSFVVDGILDEGKDENECIKHVVACCIFLTVIPNCVCGNGHTFPIKPRPMSMVLKK